MAVQGTGIYTDTLTSTTLNITASMGVFIIALLYQSGTVTVKGGNPLSGNPSTAISLSSSSPALTIGGNQSPLDSVQIIVSGSCQIIAYF
jgi:hypothetical protein